MAIRTETYELNGRLFIRTWSDANRAVVREGIAYGEANDPAELGRTYTEGEMMPSEETAEDKAEAYDILIGGTP
jgi:hypothetical protein